MYTSIFTLALLSTSVFAVQEKRQATNGEQFTNAAGQLISAYLPASVEAGLASVISDAAAKASITGDAVAVIKSALLENDVPGWFTSAIPSAWSSQFAALESGIDALRGTVGATDLVPFVVAVTKTDSAGSTIVSSITTNVPASITGIWSTVTTAVVDGVTSIYSTAFDGGSSIAAGVIGGASSVAGDVSSGGSSVASEISSGGSSVASQISSGGSSVFSEATSGASSVLSEATSGASSILNAASTALAGASSTTAAGGAAMVTACAGGVIGIMGLMIAL